MLFFFISLLVRARAYVQLKYNIIGGKREDIARTSYVSVLIDCMAAVFSLLFIFMNDKTKTCSKKQMETIMWRDL